MKFIGAFKKVSEGYIGFVEELPGVPRPKFFSPHFSAIYYPNASCYLSLWVVVICSGYPHCAPLERGDWTHRHTIDISLLWSAKLNKSTNPKLFYRHIAPPRYIPDKSESSERDRRDSKLEREAEQINDNNQPKTTSSIDNRAYVNSVRGARIFLLTP